MRTCGNPNHLVEGSIGDGFVRLNGVASVRLRLVEAHKDLPDQAGIEFDVRGPEGYRRSVPVGADVEVLAGVGERLFVGVGVVRPGTQGHLASVPLRPAVGIATANGQDRLRIHQAPLAAEATHLCDDSLGVAPPVASAA